MVSVLVSLRASGVSLTPDTWAEILGSFERINSIREKTEVLTHATHVNGWEPAVLSCMTQNFRLFLVSNLSVQNLRIFLLMYPGSVSVDNSVRRRLSAAGWRGIDRTGGSAPSDSGRPSKDHRQHRDRSVRRPGTVTEICQTVRHHLRLGADIDSRGCSVRSGTELLNCRPGSRRQ